MSDLSKLSSEMQERIRAMNALEAAQRAELTQVQMWTWDRMVTPPRRTKRARERVEVSRHPSGWVSNLGCAATQVCSSLFTVYGMRRDPYNDFHGYPDIAERAVWRVHTSRRDLTSSRYYCDHHLPDEFRPAQLEPVGGGADAAH